MRHTATKTTLPLGPVAALLLTITIVSAPAQAATPRLPAGLYPAGSTISYRPALSNHDLDCLWGFFCDGNVALFHSVTQDRLRRTDGWAQFASLHRHGQVRMGFELFASHYAAGFHTSGRSWGAEALHDLLHTTRAHGYLPLDMHPHLLAPVPEGVSSQADAAALVVGHRSSDVDLVVMACWTGTVEVEAIVMYERRSSTDRALAIRDLSRQVRLATD